MSASGSGTRRLYCSVYGCLNTTVSTELTFFRLPTETNRRSKWLKLIAREDVINKSASSYFVCEAHFLPNDILPGSHRKKLKITALPALRLPSQQQNDVGIQTELDTSTNTEEEEQTVEEPSDNVEIETVQNVQIMFCDMNAEPGGSVIDFEVDIEEHHVDMSSEPEIEVEEQPLDIPRPSAPNILKRKINQEYDHLPGFKKKINDVAEQEKETFLDLCDTFLTRELTTLAKAQAYMIPQNKKRLLNNNDYVALCFQLYLTSPQVYSWLEIMLDLPSPNILKDANPITTKINKTIMSVLRAKVNNMTDLEKNCSVAVNTIDLNGKLFYDPKDDKINGFNEVDGEQMMATAKYALVIMVRGIFVNWKQPIAYALLSEYPNHTQVDKWIDNVLKRLIEIGFTVRTFVSEYQPEVYVPKKKRKNKSAQKHCRDVAADQPYFMINNQRIYHIYDASHLLREILDMFTQHDFQFGNKIAKYEHITQFYNEDKTKVIKIAPKLTESHIDPQKFNKKDRSFPKEVFSDAVATGVSTYIDFKVIHKCGKDTVVFIKLISRLLNVLDHSGPDGYAYEDNKQIFEDMLSFFHDLEVVQRDSGPSVQRMGDQDITLNVKLIGRFQITIMSNLLLLQDLQSEGITASPRRLNLGVENLLTQVRTKCGLTTKPRPRQFITAFRQLLYSNLIKPTKKVNCDMDNVIAIVNKLTELFVETDDNASDDNDYNSIEIAPNVYNNLEVPVNHSIFYISIFLLEKCLDIHENCEILNTYASPSLDDDTSNAKYKRYFQYSKYNMIKLVIVPCDDFVNYVEKIEEKFRTSFEEKHINRKIASSIYEEIKDINLLPPPCPCFPLVYLKKLFIGMRIRFSMKFMHS